MFRYGGKTDRQCWAFVLWICLDIPLHFGQRISSINQTNKKTKNKKKTMACQPYPNKIPSHYTHTQHTTPKTRMKFHEWNFLLVYSGFLVPFTHAHTQTWCVLVCVCVYWCIFHPTTFLVCSQILTLLVRNVHCIPHYLA